MSARLIGLERDIVGYFLSRKEDLKSNAPAPVQTIKVPPIRAKPNPGASASSPSRSHWTTNRPTPSFFSSHQSRLPHIWTSGPAGSHVDHDGIFWTDCTCSEHGNCPHDDDCPCCIHYCDEDDHGQQENEDQTPTENDEHDQDVVPDGNDSNEHDFQAETTELDGAGSFY